MMVSYYLYYIVSGFIMLYFQLFALLEVLLHIVLAISERFGYKVLQ